MQSECYGTAIQAVLFLQLLSVAVAAVSEQEYNTDMPGQTEEVSAFRPVSKHNREIQTPGDILVHFTQHGAHRIMLCLEQIFRFLFIPFYLSPFIYPLLKHVSLHS